jgi:hypothetical protein
LCLTGRAGGAIRCTELVRAFDRCDRDARSPVVMASPTQHAPLSVSHRNALMFFVGGAKVQNVEFNSNSHGKHLMRRCSADCAQPHIRPPAPPRASTPYADLRRGDNLVCDWQRLARTQWPRPRALTRSAADPFIASPLCLKQLCAFTLTSHCQ